MEGTFYVGGTIKEPAFFVSQLSFSFLSYTHEEPFLFSLTPQMKPINATDLAIADPYRCVFVAMPFYNLVVFLGCSIPLYSIAYDILCTYVCVVYV